MKSGCVGGRVGGRSWWVLGAVAALGGLLMGCGRGETSTVKTEKGNAAVAAKPGIVLVKASGADDAALAVLAAYVKKEWRCPVRLAEGTIDVKSGNLDKVSETLKGTLQAGDLCAVAVCAIPDGELLNSVEATNGVGIVNVKALEAGKPEARALELRRLKEPMRAIGLAAGLKLCPFPQCGLYKAHDVAELDYKGCNYCPPCQDKMQALLKSKGIEQERIVLRLPPGPKADR